MRGGIFDIILYKENNNWIKKCHEVCFVCFFSRVERLVEKMTFSFSKSRKIEIEKIDRKFLFQEIKKDVKTTDTTNFHLIIKNTTIKKHHSLAQYKIRLIQNLISDSQKFARRKESHLERWSSRKKDKRVLDNKKRWCGFKSRTNHKHPVKKKILFKWENN